MKQFVLGVTIGLSVMNYLAGHTAATAHGMITEQQQTIGVLTIDWGNKHC